MDLLQIIAHFPYIPIHPIWSNLSRGFLPLYFISSSSFAVSQFEMISTGNSSWLSAKITNEIFAHRVICGNWRMDESTFVTALLSDRKCILNSYRRTKSQIGNNSSRMWLRREKWSLNWLRSNWLTAPLKWIELESFNAPLSGCRCFAKSRHFLAKGCEPCS